MDILETILPKPEEIIRVFGTIAQVDKGAIFSALIRALLLALVIVCIRKRKIYSGYVATLMSLILLGAGIMIIGFKESGLLVMFPFLFVLGLLWGREALILPPRPAYSRIHVLTGAAFGLAAFFYPYFTTGFWHTLLLAPMGVLPAPSILIALAAIIVTRRSYSVYTVVPTWVLGAAFGILGVFYIKKPVDWILLAGVAASIAAYYTSPAEAPRHKSKKLKRH